MNQIKGNINILKLFETIFKIIRIIINWISSEGFIGMKKGGNILCIVMIFTGVICKISTNTQMQRLTISIFACIVSFIMYIAYIMTDESRIIKFIYKKEKKPYEILKEFTHISYLYGLTVFSSITWFTTLGIIFYGSGMNVSALNKILPDSLVFILSVFTIMWFMYHIIFNKTITIKEIKVRLNFYVAIATTISTIIIWPLFQEALKPIITYLGVSYVWLAYLIEKVEIENDK